MAFDSEVISEIRSVAAEQGLDPAALLAIAEVESGGTAYTIVGGERRPVILYEYHVFYRNLPARLREVAVRQDLARRRWKELPYKRTQAARYEQLERACAIHAEAAHMACSWGIGQVLGENYAALGFPSARAMAETAMESVAGQVRVMLAFIAANRLMDELETRDWRGFARIYNGAGQVDRYADLMERAYRRHGGTDAPVRDDMMLRVGSRGELVRDLQSGLTALGYILQVDGDFGPATRRMVTLFQKENGLVADGIAGPRTLARIEALSGRRLDPAA